MYRVAFFSNHFARKQGTGVARYASNLVNAFAEIDGSPHVLPVATWSNKESNELDLLRAHAGLRLLPTGRIATRLLWMTLGVPKIEQLLDFHIDIVHASDLGYSIATGKPYVVTVHDIGPLTHPEYFRNNSYWIMQKSLELAIKKASAFISVSHSTADSLMDYVHKRYSVDLSSRTYVVYEGIAEKFLQFPDFSLLDQNTEFDLLRKPFILAVGKISPRKNLTVVINALNKIKSSVPHHLVTVGGDGWDFQDVKSLFSSLGLADRVHSLGYVSDETLNALYSKAALFIYPSLFEGFGLPILEAMASGCPVVTSNLSSLPEVAGDAALLVDPHNIKEITAAIEAICKDQSFANELRRKGRERAKLFSWKKCAEKTSAIYGNLISLDQDRML
ncbi:MAG TPA: glycosyltransferase family 1 protein [Nitrososphaeraceae archaeon]|nr:glycosyltransferase family 1 protein [Nitrososphaeraceae archaeon]